MTYPRGVVLGGLIILFDQCAKAAVRYYDIALEGGYAGIQLAQNENMSFSLPVSNTVAMAISLIVAGLLVLFLMKKQRPCFMPLVAVLAGGISNLLDRIFHGSVLDFIFIGFMHLNTADMFIIIGILLSFYCIAKESGKNQVESV